MSLSGIVDALAARTVSRRSRIADAGADRGVAGARSRWFRGRSARRLHARRPLTQGRRPHRRVGRRGPGGACDRRLLRGRPGGSARAPARPRRSAPWRRGSPAAHRDYARGPDRGVDDSQESRSGRMRRVAGAHAGDTRWRAGTGTAPSAVDAPVPTPQRRAADGPADADRVLRVTADSLNRLLGLAGESLVESRWLQPFAQSLLRLKRLQHESGKALDRLRSTLSAHPRG